MAFFDWVTSVVDFPNQREGVNTYHTRSLKQQMTRYTITAERFLMGEKTTYVHNDALLGGVEEIVVDNNVPVEHTGVLLLYHYSKTVHVQYAAYFQNGVLKHVVEVDNACTQQQAEHIVLAAWEQQVLGQAVSQQSASDPHKRKI